jgi:uncharacterized protein
MLNKINSSFNNLDFNQITIIAIHGGSSFDTYDQYLQDLEISRVKVSDGYIDWKANLRNFFTDKFNVILPRFPNSDNAKYLEWKIAFEKLLKREDLVTNNLVLIGHSLGGNFLQKYLGENRLTAINSEFKLLQLHFVAACVSEGDMTETDSWHNINSQSQNIHIWHSQDDTVVPVKEAYYYKTKLTESNLHLLENRWHINQSTFLELYSILNNLVLS